MNEFLDSLNGGREERPMRGFPLLSLKPGVERQIRVLDERAVRRDVHFFGAGRQAVICPGSDCLLCSRDEPNKVVTCCYFNVYDRAEGRVKVMFVCGSLYVELTEVVEQEGSPTSYDIIVGRKAGRNGKYYVHKISADQPVPSGLERYPLEEILVPMSLDEQEKRFGANDDEEV